MKKKIQYVLLRWFCKDAFYEYGRERYDKGVHDGELKWEGETAKLVRNAVHQGQRDTWEIIK